MKSRLLSPAWFCLAILSGVICFSSCKDDETENTSTPETLEDGVYIINEGNYQWSNGSVDFYRNYDGSLSEDLFQQTNQRPLGDVVQSMVIADGLAYIVVNNSGKVEVVNMNSFASTGTITGLTSPRYLLPLGNNKAYVSDLYSNAISIIDLGTLQKTGEVPLHGSTEEMLLSGHTVYVTNTRTSFIYMISTGTNTVVDSIAVGYASHAIRMDKEGKLWVLCAGDQAQSINAGIYRIDTLTHSVVRSFDLGNPGDIWDRMTMDGEGDALYYLKSGVWKLFITATELPSAPLISQGSGHFYGLAVDPSSGVIWVSDAKDFIQKGSVSRYHPDGSLINSFSAGIIPSGFCFR